MQCRDRAHTIPYTPDMVLFKLRANETSAIIRTNSYSFWTINLRACSDLGLKSHLNGFGILDDRYDFDEKIILRGSNGKLA